MAIAKSIRRCVQNVWIHTLNLVFPSDFTLMFVHSKAKNQQTPLVHIITTKCNTIPPMHSTHFQDSSISDVNVVWSSSCSLFWMFWFCFVLWSPLVTPPKVQGPKKTHLRTIGPKEWNLWVLTSLNFLSSEASCQWVLDKLLSYSCNKSFLVLWFGLALGWSLPSVFSSFHAVLSAIV